MGLVGALKLCLLLLLLHLCALLSCDQLASCCSFRELQWRKFKSAAFRLLFEKSKNRKLAGCHFLSHRKLFAWIAAPIHSSASAALQSLVMHLNPSFQFPRHVGVAPTPGAMGSKKKKVVQAKRLETFQKCQSGILEQVCSHVRLSMPVYRHGLCVQVGVYNAWGGTSGEAAGEARAYVVTVDSTLIESLLHEVRLKQGVHDTDEREKCQRSACCN